MSTSTKQFALRLMLAAVVAGLLAGCSLLRPRMTDPAEYEVTVEAIRSQPVETLALWTWPTSTPMPTVVARATATPTVTPMAQSAHFLPVVAAQQPLATPTASAVGTATVEVAQSSSIRFSKYKHSACIQEATETPMPAFIGSTVPPLPPITGMTCDCSGDIYSCADFESVGAAQTCFDYCRHQGRGDIHRLDEDGDRLACYQS